MDDLSEYMTTDEFAELPSAVHHAVWEAHNVRRIDVLPVSRTTSSILRYNRAQVAEIQRRLEASRG